MIEEVDITLVQGIPFIKVLSTTYNLSGARILSQIRYSPGHWKVVASFLSSVTNNTVNELRNITLSLNSTETSNIRYREVPYYYDVFVYRANDTLKLFKGLVYIDERVSK